MIAKIADENLRAPKGGKKKEIGGRRGRRIAKGGDVERESGEKCNKKEK